MPYGTVQRTCEVCGAIFESSRRGRPAQFCRPACKQAAYYRRHGGRVPADASAGLRSLQAEAEAQRADVDHLHAVLVEALELLGRFTIGAGHQRYGVALAELGRRLVEVEHGGDG